MLNRFAASRSMCGGPLHIKPSSTSQQQEENNKADTTAMNSSSPCIPNLSVETEDSLASLLELAANNDLEYFKLWAERDPSAVDEPGLWYGRKKGSARMVLQHRTPLMVAATYGSLEVLKYIFSISDADVNRRCGPDDTTALHCAASGGSPGAVEAVRLLLAAGADPETKDAHGCRPADVIAAPLKHPDAKVQLEELLGAAKVANGDRMLRVLTGAANFNAPPLSSSLDEDTSPSPGSTLSPTAVNFSDLPPLATSEKKEYPVDPSLPDIKNSIYATDEFRMFSFKVRPCSRAYSHDWTECPFVHPGENARRRDPRKFHYSCVPCPDFRKGACRRGDLCEYAHGVFECWLHPAQYRTRLCKDSTGCTRRVCFFAHTNEELRPLYVSTGSAMPSPRSSASAAMEMAAAMNLLPGSPSSVSVMSPFTPPMSPSAGNGHNPLGGWQQPAVPTLHLPGSNLQSSRLRSSLSARDMPVGDLLMSPDFEAQQQQLLNDLCFSGSKAHLGSSVMNLLGPARSKTLAPSNLDDLFSAEISSSPRYSSDQGGMFSPSHKSTVLNQFQQQQQQSLLSPINNGVFSPKAMDPQQLSGHSSLLQASRGVSSPGRMSPRGVEPMSPFSSRVAALAQREKQQQTLRSLSSRDLGSGTSLIVGSPVNSAWPNWGSPSGTLDWGVDGDELGRLRRSNSFELRPNGDEPDLSWVQSLVKEPPTENKEKLSVASAAAAAAAASVGPVASVPPSVSGEGSNSNSQAEGLDHAAVLAWLEKMQLDQMVA